MSLLIYSPSSTSPPQPSLTFNPKPKPFYLIMLSKSKSKTHSSSFNLSLSTSPKLRNCTRLLSLLPNQTTTQNPKPFNSLHFHSLSQTFSSLNSLHPYILPQFRPILFGWLCSLVSVYSLSRIVPCVGQLPAILGNLNGFTRLRDSEGLVLLGLFVLARFVACYLQQAFLWNAALSATCEIRVRVFQKILQRDMDFSKVVEVWPGILLIGLLLRPRMLQTLSMLFSMTDYCTKYFTTISNGSSNVGYKPLAIFYISIASNAEQCENARFQRLAKADLSERLKKKKMKALIPHIIQIMYFGSLVFFCACSLAISRSSFDGRDMISFVTSLIFLIEPIQGIGKAYNELKQGEPAIERLFDLTRFKPKVVEKPDAVDLNNVMGEVHFCNISFKYGENMPLVLNGLTLKIKAGETVALVGPSGGGKTTLAKLLIRLYDPLSGHVLIDNQNIQNIRLESLRRHVGLVSQDITLFSGTVAENIGYRDLMKEIDMEMVKDAAQIANADEFIRNLPKGYETNIGPRGSTLSGGQKQRLAIARALYQKSSVLILDEATSALDSRSELLVRQALERLMENHTVLVIAHRLETILMAKRVFLLENGTLQELSRNQYQSSVSRGLVI
uniref:ABC transporter domain-containing protein n=1 Tax=Cannabis sativa TaxID=3483 RepID=A0A803QK00_CANSA